MTIPDEAKLSADAHDILKKLLCDAENRLGAGGVHEIKAHPFFKGLDWTAAFKKQLVVPLPYAKKIVEIEVPLEKVYGRGAFDESLKDHNRLKQWSFVQQS